MIEESYELIEAVDGLADDGSDLVAYARIEEEVGDVLLQVLFHSAIAQESGAFDVNDAAEVLRQKLVRRHPHVFADVEVSGADEVKANWDAIKAEEKGTTSDSALEGVPIGMPALHRAAKIQNRAEKILLPPSGGRRSQSTTEAVDRVARMAEQLDDAGEDLDARIGDLLFALVDLTRRSGIDAETALRAATTRFEIGIRAGEHGR